MRDIVVTIPKSRLEAVAAEEAIVERAVSRGEAFNYFWKVGRLPKEIPRRIYFVWEGAVRAFHEVNRMTVVGGAKIFMATKIHDIEPIPMRGFQGRRYFDESESRRS